jgi:hypothetical protein
MRKSVLKVLTCIALLTEFVFMGVQAVEQPIHSDDTPLVQKERIEITVHNDTWSQKTMLKGSIDYKQGGHEDFTLLIEGITDICPRITNHIHVPKGLVKSIGLRLSNYRDDPQDDDEATVIAILLLKRLIPSTLISITFTIYSDGIVHEPQFHFPPVYHQGEARWY